MQRLRLLPARAGPARRRPARALLGLVVFLGAGGGFGLGGGPALRGAAASPDAELLTPAKRAQMIDEIVNGNTALRRGHLAALKGLPDGVEGREYGNVVGPILREARHLEGKDPAEATQILYELIEDLLLHQPAAASADVILLDGLVLQQLARSPELVKRLRDNLPLRDGRQADWERLLAHAARRLADEDAAVRRAAIRALSWSDPSRLPDALARVHDALARATPEARRGDAPEYLATLKSLLGLTFDDLDDALEFFKPFAPRFERREGWTPIERETLRADLERASKLRLLARGQREVDRQRAVALDLGRQLVARAQAPEGLLPLFAPDKEYPPELYREALRHARTRLKPEASRPWADLVVAALKRTPDTEALGELTELLAGSFTQPSEVSDPVADAVGVRLREGVGRDPVPQRVRLAEVLDRIARTPLQVRQALPDRLDPSGEAQREVWVRLVKALGGRSGAVTEILLPYYRLDGRPTHVAYRRAVAEAFGRAAGLDEAEKGTVAHVLRHLLVGEAEPPELVARFGGREPDGEVRQALLLALAEYPTPESVEVLAGLAASEDAQADKEARIALDILGRLWSLRSVAAGRALVGLTAREHRRRASLELLKRVPRDLEAVHCDSVCTEVRSLLDAPIPPEEKALAADVVIGLRDLGSFPGLYRLWGGAEGEARQAWGARLVAWAAAVAGRATPEGDQALGQALDLLAAEGHVELALGALKGLPEASLQRAAVQFLRVRLLFAGANDGTREVADRRRMADEALRHLARLFPQLKGEEAVRARAMGFSLNQARAGELKAAEEAALPFQLEACRAAADARDPALAARGLEVLGALEGQEGLAEPVRTELKALRQRLEAARAAPNANGSE